MTGWLRISRHLFVLGTLGSINSRNEFGVFVFLTVRVLPTGPNSLSTRFINSLSTRFNSLSTRFNSLSTRQFKGNRNVKPFFSASLLLQDHCQQRRRRRRPRRPRRPRRRSTADHCQQSRRPRRKRRHCRAQPPRWRRCGAGRAARWRSARTRRPAPPSARAAPAPWRRCFEAGL